MSQSAVVRVFATTQEPDLECPWQSDPPSDGSGSGVVIGDRQVLTGAHVVANATFIQAQKISDPEKYVAHVHGLCHDADLALLRIDDPRFMSDVEPAVLGDLPDFQDRIAVVGFPIGGDEISITEGVVSRIEVQEYTHSQRRLLAVTVDAAINDGNSGGPVFGEDGSVAGIAFQTMDDAENVGEMVPAPVIARFLRGVERGLPLEVPGLGVRSQNLENPTLRRVLGMGDSDSGVLVEDVEHASSVDGMLQPGDALMAIDGHRIANNGTIRYRDRYRTSFDVVLGGRFIGDRLPLTVLRGGERRRTEIRLAPFKTLVPRSQYDRPPSWFVFGGIVFQMLRRDYLRTWDKWWDRAPKELLHLYYSGVSTSERREVIVLSQVLADDINVGYAEFNNEVLLAVNGHRPVDFADFVRTVDACRGLLDLRTTLGGRLVFDAGEARAAAARILARYRLPGDRSPDLA